MAIDNIPLDDTLFIDPGVSGTGWAFFPQKGKPEISGVIRSQGMEWLETSYAIALDLEIVADKYDVLHVGIEFPEMWGGSHRSQTSAAQGDLFKLAFLCGSIHQRLQFPDYMRHLALFTVRDWKGQLSKEIVIQRIHKHWGLSPKNHEADAIGMGLAAQGLL